MVSLAAAGVVYAAGARTVPDLPDLSDLPELTEPVDPAELATDLLFSFLAGVGSFLAGVGSFLGSVGVSRPVGFCAKALCARTSTENRAARSVRKIAHEGFLPIMSFNNLLMNSTGNEYAGVYLASRTQRNPVLSKTRSGGTAPR